MTMATSTPSTGYFESYADPTVHEVMLRDKPRMTAYRTFFEENRNLIEGKVVMDVGAGTGILSLWAACAGAKKVYAVEASPVASLCKENVERNGFADVIEVIHSTVEDVSVADVMVVDVIVSEWMGFYLLHESMMDSVIAARDKFLAKDGILVPSIARMYVAPVNMEKYLEQKFAFWENVQGFDFSAATSLVKQKLLREPLTTELTVQQLVTPPKLLKEFDLKTVSVADTEAFSENVQFAMEKTATVHGFAIWFDVDFRQGESISADGDWTVACPSVLSTSPAHPVTHWKQTVILFPDEVTVTGGETLGCNVGLAQDSAVKRHYNITLELNSGDDDDNNNADSSTQNGSDMDETEEGEEHPVPCDCGGAKCELIKALISKYEQEQDELAAEAEVVDLTAAEVAGDTIEDIGEADN